MLETGYRDYTTRIITLKGDRAENSPLQLRKAFVETISEGIYDVVVDISQVNLGHMDLGIFVERGRQLRCNDGSLKIVNSNEYNEKLIKMCGLTEFMGAYSSLEEAISS